jgi:CRISPR-associated exonuclease Cas4
MDPEEDLLPLSALQHIVFCERQAALIHIEQLWRDNALTLEGHRLHERVDESGMRRECRGDLVIVRSLALRSLHLKVSGRADVVEFHKADQADPNGVELAGLQGRWRPFPVEYKRGRPSKTSCDKVQLCAQAICLEEMLAIRVTEGALFYGRSQRRYTVQFDEALRSETEQASERLHMLFNAGTTPRAQRQAKCKRCSLETFCMPRAMTRRSGRGYLEKALQQALEGTKD